MKRQIIYRLTEILSFYAFLRPDDGLLLYRGTYLLTRQGKYTKLTSEIYSTLVTL